MALPRASGPLDGTMVTWYLVMLDGMEGKGTSMYCDDGQFLYISEV